MGQTVGYVFRTLWLPFRLLHWLACLISPSFRAGAEAAKRTREQHRSRWSEFDEMMNRIDDEIDAIKLDDRRERVISAVVQLKNQDAFWEEPIARQEEMLREIIDQ